MRQDCISADQLKLVQNRSPPKNVLLTLYTVHGKRTLAGYIDIDKILFFLAQSHTRQAQTSPDLLKYSSSLCPLACPGADSNGLLIILLCKGVYSPVPGWC